METGQQGKSIGTDEDIGTCESIGTDESMETDTSRTAIQEMDKRSIRKAVLQIRDALDEEERKRSSILLTERILGHQWFYRAEYFLCFVSFGSEISTREILQEALRRGKRVYVPKVTDEKTAEMRFYRIASVGELHVGYRGIPEPVGDTAEYEYTAERAEHTLMLVPGVAFDPFRNRLGYGRGFYDRFLADKEVLRLYTIAVGYMCQMVEELPVAGTDIKPYQVICV